MNGAPGVSFRLRPLDDAAGGGSYWRQQEMRALSRAAPSVRVARVSRRLPGASHTFDSSCGKRRIEFSENNFCDSDCFGRDKIFWLFWGVCEWM